MTSPHDHLGVRSKRDSSWLRATKALAVRLVSEATRLHRDRLDGRKTIDTKSSVSDLVSEVDRDCEALLVETLKTERPDDSILAEEMTVISGQSGVRWAIDPLDGTANYLHGYPAYGASVAAEVDGTVDDQDSVRGGTGAGGDPRGQATDRHSALVTCISSGRDGSLLRSETACEASKGPNEDR